MSGNGQNVTTEMDMPFKDPASRCCIPAREREQTRRGAPEMLLPERDAAMLLGVSTSWLQKQRWRGTGPAYVRVGGRPNGAVRYLRSGLERWIEQNRVVPTQVRRG